MPLKNENIGLAIALVCGAGASTTIGASVVFFPQFVKIASRRVLASSLGISAGVMTYVSYVEIFHKSYTMFIEAGNDENRAYQYATICFFSGVLLVLILDMINKYINDEYSHKNYSEDNRRIKMYSGNIADMRENHIRIHKDISSSQNSRNSKDSILELDEWKLLDVENEEKNNSFVKWSTKGIYRRLFPIKISSTDNGKDDNMLLDSFNDKTKFKEGPKSGNTGVDMNSEEAHLARMGFNTALAISLHNFPEGLATFFGALDDPFVGLVIAIAIGLHNIPEGLCVALPIYYATGSRRKAFLWSVLSGISEPIAALLGWAVLYNSFSDSLYALMFGLVSGMMVTISVKELIPTAHRYDPHDTVVTYSFIFGMAIISLSLVLFMV